MSSFNTRIPIDAPAERVWDVISDVVGLPKWLPTVTSVHALGTEALAVGARYRVVQPRLRPAVWSVVELVQNSHFSWETRGPGVRTLASHVMERVSDNSTRVSLGIECSGPLSGLVGLLVGRLTREYIEREAAAMKQRAEFGAL